MQLSFEQSKNIKAAIYTIIICVGLASIFIVLQWQGMEILKLHLMKKIKKTFYDRSFNSIWNFISSFITHFNSMGISYR